MQATAPVTVDDLLGPVQEMLYKLEVWDGSAWLNLNSLDGKRYQKRISLKLGGAGASPNPVAGTWSAEVLNEDGIFHPFHPTSAFAGLFRVGRKVRISIGAKYAGLPFHWQRLIGYMDAPVFNHEAKTVSLKGIDFMKRLADTDLRSPDNYWGGSATFSTVATTTGLGAEIYAEGDAMEIGAGETNNVAGWTPDANSQISSTADVSMGSAFVGLIEKLNNPPSTVSGPVVGAVVAGTVYEISFDYFRSAGEDGSIALRAYVGAALAGYSNNGESETPEHLSFQFTALSNGPLQLKWRVLGDSGTAFHVDNISIKPVTTPGVNAVYALPDDSNGPYFATLNGTPIWNGDPPEKFGWVSAEGSNIFSFVEGTIITAGTDNLVVYYYTDQVLENVVADLLVRAGYYADRAAALAAMDYEPTGIVLSRVWFESGTKALAVLKLICERAGYRFWFAFDGTPCFKPAPEATSPVFTFTSPARVQDPGVQQDRAEIRNRIVIEGIEQAMFSVNENKKRTRLSGTVSDATSIAEYTEHTLTITNHLFQDQTSIDAMCAELLAAYKDPKWYTELRTPFNPVPLELGDTIAWPVELAVAVEPGAEPIVVELQGIVRDIAIDMGQIAYKCEIVPAGGEMMAHALLSATHPDTEEAAPELGDLVLASGDSPAPAAAGSPEHELLSEMHEDTEAAEPEAADVIMASGDPVLWRRLPAGTAGQVFEMGASLPKWGRKITSADDPPGSGEGSDGDIWLEY